jgi:hypothetical protein
MTCVGFIEPLNLQCLLINTFAESFLIFFFIALIIIAILSAKFKLPNFVFLAIVALFTIMMYPYGVDKSVYILVIVITALITFYSTSKI